VLICKRRDKSQVCWAAFISLAPPGPRMDQFFLGEAFVGLAHGATSLRRRCRRRRRGDGAWQARLANEKAAKPSTGASHKRRRQALDCANLVSVAGVDEQHVGAGLLEGPARPKSSR
jgi:hypothetical protein